jgi:hypothetical protein
MITSGLLVLAGVGDEESRSRREAEARELRIDNNTRQTAADIIRNVDFACDAVDEPNMVEGDAVFTLLIEDSQDNGSENSKSDRLSQSELREVSNRLDDEIRSQCEELGLYDG